MVLSVKNKARRDWNSHRIRVQTIGDIVPFGLHFDNVRAYKGFPCVFWIGVDMEKDRIRWIPQGYTLHAKDERYGFEVYSIIEMENSMQ